MIKYFFNKGVFIHKIVLSVVLVFGLCAYASPKINNETDVFEKILHQNLMILKIQWQNLSENVFL